MSYVFQTGFAYAIAAPEEQRSETSQSLAETEIPPCGRNDTKVLRHPRFSCHSSTLVSLSCRVKRDISVYGGGRGSSLRSE